MTRLRSTKLRRKILGEIRKILALEDYRIQVAEVNFKSTLNVGALKMDLNKLRNNRGQVNYMYIYIKSI